MVSCCIKYLVYKIFIGFKCNLCFKISKILKMHIKTYVIFIMHVSCYLVGWLDTSNLSCCKLLPHNQLSLHGHQLLFQRFQKRLSSSLELEVIWLEVIFNFLKGILYKIVEQVNLSCFYRPHFYVWSMVLSTHKHKHTHEHAYLTHPLTYRESNMPAFIPLVSIEVGFECLGPGDQSADHSKFLFGK